MKKDMSDERENLEYMKRCAILARLAHAGKPYPEADKLIDAVSDEIYYASVREQEARDDARAAQSANKSAGYSDVDNLRTLTVGSRSTTFIVSGRPATFGEFRA